MKQRIDYLLFELAEKYNLKADEGCVFGVIDSQLVVIRRGVKEELSVSFKLLEGTKAMLSKDVLGGFSRMFKTYAKINIADDLLVVSDFKFSILKDGISVKVIKVIEWCCEELKKIQKEDRTSKEVVLFNEIPNIETEESKREYENKLKLSLTLSPINNAKGFYIGGLISLLIGLGAGFMFGSMERGVLNPLWGYLVFLTSFVFLFSKVSNGFDEKSWMYLVPVNLLAVVLVHLSYFYAFSTHVLHKEFLPLNVVDNLNAVYPNGFTYLLILQIVVSFVLPKGLKTTPTRLNVLRGRFYNDVERDFYKKTKPLALFLRKALFVMFFVFFVCFIIFTSTKDNFLKYRVQQIYLWLICTGIVGIVLFVFSRKRFGRFVLEKHPGQKSIEFYFQIICMYFVALLMGFSVYVVINALINIGHRLSLF